MARSQQFSTEKSRKTIYVVISLLLTLLAIVSVDYFT